MPWYEGKIQSATIIRKINYVFDGLNAGNFFRLARARARETEKIQFGLDPATRNRVRNKRQLRLGEQGLIALGDTGPSGGLGGMKTAR